MHMLGRILASTSTAGAGGVWPCVLIEAGRSKNGLRYPEHVIREAVSRGVFEGRPAALYPYVRADGTPYREHAIGQGVLGQAPRNVVGVYRNVRWSESAKAAVGDLHLSLGKPEADEMHRDLQAHAKSGAIETLGLSIDALGDVGSDQTVRVIEACTEITIVTDPAAGGRFTAHRLAASVRSSSMFDKILRVLRESHGSIVGVYTGPETERALERHIARRISESEDVRASLVAAFGASRSPKVQAWYGPAKSRLAESIDIMGALDEAAMLMSMVREELIKAQAAAASGDTPEPAAAPAAPAPAPEPLQESTGNQRLDEAYTAARSADQAAKESEAKIHALQVEMTPNRLREACRSARLTEEVTNLLLDRHAGEALTAQRCARIAESHRSVLDTFAATQTRSAAPLVTVTGDRQDKLTEALAYMFSPRHCKLTEGQAQPWMGSLHRFLEVHFMPTRMNVRESMQGALSSRRQLREAVTAAQFDQVFADALDRSVLAEYRGNARFAAYEQMVRVVPYSDFRTHRVIQIGYYGNLPDVAEGAPYLQLTTPADREETIALGKKGGLETITMEQFLNDDLTLWQTLISRIGRSAMETRYTSVMKLMRFATQPTMTDGKTLMDSTRTGAYGTATAGTAVLSADATGKTNFINTIRYMAAQTGGSGVAKGILPKFCIIPLAKIEAYAYVANQLTGGNSGTDTAQALLSTLGAAIPQPMIDYAEGTNTDWKMLADPADAEVFRFATLGGRNAPEVFIADDERFGSMFTSDTLQLKVRDIHATAAVDFAGIYGNDAGS